VKSNRNVCLTTELARNHNETFSPIFDFYSSGMIVSSTLVSMLSVLLVAIDRFLYILYGMTYQQYIFPNRARILIATTWIIGELLAAFFK
jgi:7 transmembrane receptor (rhodopsin family)